MLRVLSPLATKSYSATKRLGSFSLGPARRFSLEFHRAASLRPCGSKSDATGLCKASGRQAENRDEKGGTEETQLYFQKQGKTKTVSNITDS
jgi:hypothetical protein